MTSKPKIWVSHFRSDSKLKKSIGLQQLSNEVAVANRQAFSVNDRIEPTALPKYLYWSKKDIPAARRSRLPPLFSAASGHWCVNEKLKLFLEGFEIGDTQFIPVPLYEYDQKSPRPDKLFFFNLTTKKDTIIPERCEGISKISERSRYSPGNITKQLVVEELAAEGADIWIDPKLLSCVFFSDRIVKAMKGTGLGTYAFKECLVV